MAAVRTFSLSVSLWTIIIENCRLAC